MPVLVLLDQSVSSLAVIKLTMGLPIFDSTFKVPINPKFLFCLNKSFYNSEQNGANIFVFGQNRNFL